MEVRGRDIGALFVRQQVNPESNLCYGEGGAGTWSDGKLTTRIGRNSDPVRQVLDTLYRFGAPDVSAVQVSHRLCEWLSGCCHMPLLVYARIHVPVFACVDVGTCVFDLKCPCISLPLTPIERAGVREAAPGHRPPGSHPEGIQVRAAVLALALLPNSLAVYAATPRLLARRVACCSSSRRCNTAAVPQQLHTAPQQLRSVPPCRQHLIELGCEVRFGSRVEQLVVRNGRVGGVQLAGEGGCLSPHTLEARP